MSPKATPPLGSNNNQPILVPPSFDELYEQACQKHAREEWRGVLMFIGAISAIAAALYISHA